MSERPLTANIRSNAPPLTVAEYEEAGGYQALRKALTTLAPAEVTKLIKEANLRGRGGAGFPTGVKWGFVPMGADAPRPKYLVVNADEMEPGTFKDRLLLEGDPHLMVESMILSAYAIEAEIAYIFLRGEYVLAGKRVGQAIDEARARGYLGRNILGTGYSLQIYMHMSAGRYICGEETALLNSLEGKRAIPRAKPPFPQTSGLFGKPTIVNNVETLCNVPHIVNRGVEWFKKLSRTKNGGTKLYGVSGKVKKPGVWELPMGTTAREILEEHAGGMRDGLQLRGIIPGGASTEFLFEEHLDLMMDFDTVQQAGSRLGTGTMIVLDDRTCPVGMVHNLTKFFAHESCGWCTPCREGLPWLERILKALEDGKGATGDLEEIRTHVKFLGPGLTYCPLAPGAMAPLGSALNRWRDDFEKHIRERRCPWR
ncbi:MAG: NADH-quinone oxidoreductase subunit NuoF [Candidatus Hydrogenedentes bacterium]|nr:NADH-quinone oxidoreductase subunit NuoF [Candidatus Hydrogenedentota bacterium]